VKRLGILGLLLTSCAVAGELPDEGILITPAERRALVEKMMDLQLKIDDLQRAVEKEKVRTNCA